MANHLDSKLMLPLHIAQQEVFYDQLSDPDSPHYNTGGYVVFKGDIKKKLLLEALESIPEVFDAFRSQFDFSQEEPSCSFPTSMPLVEVPEVDYRQFDNPRQKALTWMQDRFDTAFDLGNNQLFENYLLQVDDDEIWWYQKYHHLITDGFGFVISIQYIAAKYNALVAQDPDAPAFEFPKYEDEIEGSEKYLASESYQKDAKYWQELFADVPEPLLEKQRLEGEVQTVERISVKLSEEQKQRFLSTAEQHKTSLQGLTLAALTIYYAKTTRNKDLVFGVPLHKRRNRRQRNMVGMFAGILPFRSSYQPELLVSELIAEVKKQQRSDYRYQGYPISHLNRELNLFAKGRNQLHDIVVNYEPLNFELNIPNVATEARHLSCTRGSTPALEFRWCDYGADQPLELKLDFRKSYFTAEEIRLVADRLFFILDQFETNSESKLSEIAVLPTEEQQLLLGEKATAEGLWFNPPSVELENDRPINVRFEEIAAQYSDDLAVIYGEEEWTYLQLNNRANQIGNGLKNLGVKSGDFVAVYMERSPELIASLLGILKCGAAYVPVDTQNPEERIAKMIDYSEAKVLLTSADLLNNVQGIDSRVVWVLDQEVSVQSTEGIELRDSSFTNEQSQGNLQNINGLGSWAYLLFTSGSTGMPKGAISRHDGALNHILAEYRALELGDGFRFLQSAGIGSDISVWQILGPLLKGGAAVIIDRYSLLDFDRVVEVINQYQINIVEFVPSYAASLLNHLKEQATLPSLDNLNWLMFTGENLPVKQTTEWKKYYPSLRLLNGYGPCEASDDVVQYEVTEVLDNLEVRVPIGRPVDNVQILILDNENNLCPIGVSGELCIGGIAVGDGYWNMPERTEKAFVNHPFSENSEDKIYRTGDLAQWQPDGNLVFLGRIDRQIKINGHRVEVGEIEASLREEEGIAEVHVVVHKDEQSQEFLIAFFKPTTEEDQVKDLLLILQEKANQSLPLFMQPTHYHMVSEMPLNLSDKIDSNKLLDLFLSEGDFTATTNQYVAPRTNTEVQLASIWAELLQKEEISVQASFFALGGHSLLCNRMVSNIRKELGQTISIKDVFMRPTIEGLATFIDARDAEKELPIISARSIQENLPLSYEQERLWFVDRLNGSVHYHMPAVLRFRGDLNEDILERVFQKIVNRHEVLRTVLKEDNGQIFQEILGPDQWSMTRHLLDQEISKAEIDALIDEIIQRPFELSNDHMLRVHLLELSKQEYLMVMVLHHIAADGWSVNIFIEELAEQYRAEELQKEANLPDLAIQYADYAVWQNEYLSGDVLDEKLSYWENKLRGVEPLNLPLDYVPPTIQSTNGETLIFNIDQELSEQLKALAKEQDVTLFMLLLAAFKVLLHRYSGQEDICVGTTIANRTQIEVEPLIGFFVNTIALRSNFSGNPTFTDFLNQIKEDTLEAYAYQDVPFEKVVDRIEKGRDLSRSPIFQALFELQNEPDVPGFNLPGVQVDVEPLAKNSAKFELSFTLTDTKAGLFTEVEYCTDLFEAASMERLFEHYCALLQNLVRAYDQPISNIPFLLEEEELLILGQKALPGGQFFNAPAKDLGNRLPINLRFEQVVAYYANEKAVVDDSTSWTYQELNDQANQIGRGLISLGVQAGDYVGVYLERSPFLIASFLGIIKAGAIYVPLDTQNPADRIEKMIESCSLSVLITDKKQLENLNDIKVGGVLLSEEADQNVKIKCAQLKCRLESQLELIDYSKANLPNRNQLDSVAYVLYTSGSTGQPKGAKTRHNGALNHLLAEYELLGLEDGFSFLQSAGIGSDISVWQFIGPLLKGGIVRIIQKFDLLNFGRVVEVLERERITVAEFVPSYTWGLIEYLKSKGKTAPLKDLTWIMLSGEEAPVKLVNELKEFYPHIRILNAYGPCEASDDVVQYEVEKVLDQNTLRVPIGRPIPNMNVVILDQNGALCPIGVTGELCITGVGVGPGYHAMPERTAESFVENPFPSLLGETMYKTGDLAKWRLDGQVDFLGRKDAQVKIRGNRVETGEIEALIRGEEGIKEAHVLAYNAEDGQDYLVAFFIPELVDSASSDSALAADQQDNTILSLQERCRQGLPLYMQPTNYLQLEEMPLNLSDKVDNRKLLEIFLAEGIDNSAVVEEYVAPRTKTEEGLAAIWSELLQQEELSVKGSFFALGGHSLLCNRMVSAIHKQMGVTITIKDVFIYPTIEALASFIDERDNSYDLPSISKRKEMGRYPLSFAQERLWFIDRLNGTTHYHMPAILRFKGNLDLGILEGVFQQIVDRHEVLRTVIKEESGFAYQEVLAAGRWSMQVHDFKYEIGANSLDAIIDEIVSSPFNLSKDHMLRVHLIQLSKEENLLVIVLHHIAADSWSVNIFIDELVELYKSAKLETEAKLDPLDIQYADYAVWQNDYLKGEVLERKLSYWEEKLKDVEPISLPLDFVPPAMQSIRGATRYFNIEPALTNQLKNLAKEQDVTLFMLLIGAFKLLLHRYSGQDDICVGTSIANRNELEIEKLLGFFVNTIALRSNFADNPSFPEFLARLKKETLEAYAHQDVPFEKVVDRVEKERDTSRSPIFQAMFELQNEPDVPNFSLPGVQLQIEHFKENTAKFELSFTLTDTDEGLLGEVEYCTDLFDVATIDRLFAHYRQLLSSIVLNVDKSVNAFPFILPEEQALILGYSTAPDDKRFNPKARHLGNTLPINLRFEQMAARYPKSLAIADNEGQWTYQELNEKANQIGRCLQDLGLGIGDHVGVYLERSPFLVASILGILKAGGVYIPVDTQNPAFRVGKMMANSDLSILISERELLQGLDQVPAESILLSNAKEEITPSDRQTYQVVDAEVLDQYSTANLPNRNQMDSVAYILFTSGSTGQPKGAKTLHNGALNHLLAEYELLELADGFSFLQSASIGSDISVWQILGPLLKGGSLRIIQKYDLLDYGRVLDILENESINVVEFVPSYAWGLVEHIQGLNDSPKLEQLQWMMVVGEEVPVRLVNALKKAYPTLRVLNAYGPCEASDDVIQYEVTEFFNANTPRVPIGRPIPNMNAVILDQHGALCPIGVTGELCVTGIGVGTGYLGMPEKTAESFVNNPFFTLLGDVMYKTGDLAKWRPDGMIEFLGRKDNQVKIRGNRVETGEIEALIREEDFIKDIHVLVYQSEEGQDALIAFFTVTDENIGEAEARQTLQERCHKGLPLYMEPTHYCLIENMPLNLSDKVDKKKLIALFQERNIEDTQYQIEQVPPRNNTERELAAIWSDLLDTEINTVQESFFSLGGHSLLCNRMVSAIHKRMGLAISIKDVFVHPSIEALANYIDNRDPESKFPVIKKRTIQDRIPLSYAQERLWFIDRLGGTVHYHMPAVLRFKGNLDITLLEDVFQQIVDRHEVLRSVIKEEEGYAFQVVRDPGRWQMQVEEYQSGISEEDLQNQIESLIAQPFDLSKDHMLRVHLLRLADEEFILVLVLHHIAADGWSVNYFIEELVELYQSAKLDQESNLPVLAIQYADYAVWQHEYLAGIVLEEKLAFWEQKLKGVEPLNLPLDFVPPAMQSNRGKALHFELDLDLSLQLKALARTKDVTLFQLLLAAFKVLLYRYSGQENICVGTTIANRTQLEVEPLIGFFVNTIALRSDLSDKPTFADFLQRIKTETLEAYAHQDVPFEKVVDRIEQGRDTSRSPIFQALFELQNEPDVPTPQLEDLTMEVVEYEETTAKFELSFTLTDTVDGLIAEVEFCTDLFLDATIDRLFAHYQSLLQGILKDNEASVDALSFILPEEEALILGQKTLPNGIRFNPLAKDLGNDKTINQLFEETVSQFANKPAVSDGHTSWTYAKLNEKANQIADCLLSMGLRPGDNVGIYLDRSPALVAGFLGIIKAGGIYVPLDTLNPIDRIEKMIDNSQLICLISEKPQVQQLDKLFVSNLLIIDKKDASLERKAEATACLLKDASDLANCSKDNPANRNQMDSVAYILYTSGSTGQPKGAKTRHNGAINHLLAEYELLELKDGFRFLQSAGIGSDISVWQFLGPLLKGGSLRIIQKYDLLNFDRVIEVINQEKINLLEFVPSYTWGLLEHIKEQNKLPRFNDLQWIMLSGEEAPVRLVNELKSYYPNLRVLNAYGPCETSDDVVQYEVEERLPDTCLRVPIGRPIPNMNVVILDANGALCPIGVSGELCITGVGVGPGYQSMPEKTAQSFVPNLFPSLLGDMMYKTGDLAKWRPDGQIEFLGRKDAQVKIRGNRVELGEIESLLRKSPGVKDLHILIHQIDQEPHIISFVVPNSKEIEQTESALRALAQEVLPPYMWPSYYGFLEELPVNLSDKVDKIALINWFDQQEFKPVSQQEEFIAPSSSTEVVLAEIWQELLGLSQVSANANFFNLGGHSLLATRIIAQIKNRLGVEVEIRQLFLHPILSDLAISIDQSEAGDLLPDILIAERSEQMPLSFAQERLWFIDQLEGSVHYHMPAVLRFEGNIDADALEFAFRQIIERHQILRTVYRDQDGIAYQTILPTNDWKLDQLDLSDEKNIDQAYLELLDQRAARAFDLAQDYQLRAELVKLAEEEYALLLVIHHIASDGWSESILTNELVEIYQAKVENRQANLPALNIQYLDYAVWQRKYQEGAWLESRLDYWEEQLADLSPLELPTDFTRPAIQSTKGETLYFTIEEELLTQLNKVCQEQKVTLFMVLLAAFKVLLSKYAGQQDICVGTPVANRTREDVESLIGLFVNTLPLRTDLSENPSIQELLQRVQKTTLTALSYQEVPFEKIVDRVQGERDMSRSPIFQTAFVLQNTPELPPLELDGVTLSADPINHETSKFDITFSVEEEETALSLTVDYCKDLFLPNTIRQMVRHYYQILDQIATNLDTPINELKLLSQEERKQVLLNFNDTDLNVPQDKNLVSLFEDQVLKSPDQIALVSQDQEISYQSLNERANQIAGYLIKNYRIQPEDFIAIQLPPSDWAVATILGILKSGAAYLPIDPAYPEDRVQMMLDDAQAKFIINEKELDKVKGSYQDYPNTNPDVDVKPHQLAYVLYTSGSTGLPKGVCIEHRNVVNEIWSQANSFQIEASDRILQAANYVFDTSVEQIFMTLCHGASLILTDKNSLLDTTELEKLIDQQGITHLHLPPALLRNVQPRAYKALRRVLCGAETVPLELAKAWSPYAQFYNKYGPTETTINSSIYCFEPEKADQLKSLPIGKPLANTQFYIVNPQGKLVPPGVIGELWIAGAGLARGYHKRPELTKEKFTENPLLPGQRIYRTGDLCRWLPDGNVEFIGRKDHQVKIRGYRIEIGEIESVLQQSPQVNNAVVLVKTDENNTKRLIAYITTEEVYDKKAIDQHLRTHLPDYMIPSMTIALESFPLTASGKVNKKALPEPDFNQAFSDNYVAPRNEIEEDMANVWKELLRLDKIGINDNFFELGGDSIITIQVVSRAAKLGYRLQPRDLFQHQTIASLAEHLANNETNAIIAEQGYLTGRAELLPIQKRFFERNIGNLSHYNQANLLSVDKQLSNQMLDQAITALLEHHDALRFSYQQDENGWWQEYKDNLPGLEIVNLQQLPLDELAETIAQQCDEFQASLDIEQGPLVRVVLFETPEEETYNRLLMVIHHLAVDGVSWRILMDHLESSIGDLRADKTINLGKKTSSFRDWVKRMQDYAVSEKVEDQLDYWSEITKDYQPFPVEQETEQSLMKDVQSCFVSLDESYTKSLLQDTNNAYQTEINDILLSALALTIHHWSGQQKVIVGLEGHGREDIATDVDITSTVGWFTNLYPVALPVQEDMPENTLIKSVKEALRSMPDKGMGYGALRYLHPNEEFRSQLSQGRWDIIFNYLGQFDGTIKSGSWFSMADESTGKHVPDDSIYDGRLEINGMISEGRLVLNWSFSNKEYQEKTIQKLAKLYMANLENLIEHCLGKQDQEFSPADYGLSGKVSVDELDDLLGLNETEGDEILKF